MKKTTTKATKKTTKKVELPEPIEIDITNINTFDKMYLSFISAKLDKGFDINAEEVSTILTIFANQANSLFSKQSNTISLLMMICLLVFNDINWARRPWYKKLMFWKKKPEFKLEF
jgi:hypothetical protein